MLTHSNKFIILKCVILGEFKTTFINESITVHLCLKKLNLRHNHSKAAGVMLPREGGT